MTKTQKAIRAEKQTAKAITRAAVALQNATKAVEKKPFWKSKTVWFLIAIVAAGIGIGVVSIVLRF